MKSKTQGKGHRRYLQKLWNKVADGAYVVSKRMFGDTCSYQWASDDWLPLSDEGNSVRKLLLFQGSVSMQPKCQFRRR
jgi:hypothetical protein